MMSPEVVPLEFVQAIGQLSPNPYLAPLLWQRGLRDLNELPGFLDAAKYVPTAALAFGEPMVRSALRLQQAIASQETIGLWPDLAPDGITATALLWEGLSGLNCCLRIANLNHSILSIAALNDLQPQGISLLIIFNLGCLETEALDYAKTIGIDIISLDHHRNDRLNVYAQLNARQLERSHPFATLPSVAIAYKLMEAVLGQEPRQLLDLVAIGMLSDLVDFTGDARYLFQISIPVLQAQSNAKTATRPSLLKLLNYCKNRGDRATDVHSGLGPRIRALCQIQPDRCLDLLIGSDDCETIADQAELAHVRLLALHQEVLDQALQMIRGLDLSMHEAIVLMSSQWSVKALPSVANAIAEQFQKTTFLFSTEESETANGVGRSDLDLYALLQSQDHLLERTIGHPNALNISLPGDNLEIFIQAIQHQLRLRSVTVKVRNPFDLCVTVDDLGETLFKALRSIEPCGLSNPFPRLLLKNVRFEQVFTGKIKDNRHQSVIYRCAEFKLCDRSGVAKIDGHWWGHGQDDLPKGDCDAIVELENNGQKKRYDVRLIQWFDHSPSVSPSNLHPILDRRHHLTSPLPNTVRLTTCPSDWNSLKSAYRRSVLAVQPLVLDYRLPTESDFTTLLGIAKYLARTGESVSPQQWCDRLSISAPTLQIGLEALRKLGFVIKTGRNGLAVARASIEAPAPEVLTQVAEDWARSARRERFRQQYFMQVSLEVLRAFLAQAMG
jgi:single-stranded-DNA-specific exonuclease